MLQLIPLGVEYTVPLPLAPPATVRVKVVGAGTKVAATDRSRSMVIWQTCGASTSGVQVAPHSASSFSTAPPTAVAVTLTTVPAANVPPQIPLAAAPAVPPVIEHSIPPRFEVTTPLAELLPVPTVS